MDLRVESGLRALLEDIRECLRGFAEMVSNRWSVARGVCVRRRDDWPQYETDFGAGGGGPQTPLVLSLRLRLLEVIRVQRNLAARNSRESSMKEEVFRISFLPISVSASLRAEV